MTALAWVKLCLVIVVLAGVAFGVVAVVRWYKRRGDDGTLSQAAEELARRDVERARKDAEIARATAEAEARKRIQAEQDGAKGRRNGSLTDAINRARADTKP